MILRLSALPAFVALLTAPTASADSGARKDPDVALEVSAAGATVSLALIAAGLAPDLDIDSGLKLVGLGLASGIFTPSLGAWYAGKYWTGGLGLRLAGAAAMVTGLAKMPPWCFDQCTFDEKRERDANESLALMGLGLAGYLGGMVWDIAAAPSAAREFNASHHVVLAPTVLGAARGGPAYGLGIAGGF